VKSIVMAASCIFLMILSYGCRSAPKPAAPVEQQAAPSPAAPVEQAAPKPAAPVEQQAAPKPPAPVEYEKGAIKLTLTADPKLNLYQGNYHTLLLCLYELKDPNAFNQLVDEADGFARLMECSRFDPSVAYVKRVILQPGSRVKEELDRAEGAKYLALVAGYFEVQKERPLRLYRIPAGAMWLDVDLGPLGIRDSEGNDGH